MKIYIGKKPQLPYTLHLPGSKVIWLIFFFLSLISVLAIYSSVNTLAIRYKNWNAEYYLFRHVFHLTLGFGMIYLMSRIPYQLSGKWINVLLGVAITLLLYVIFQGEESQINEASRWIRIYNISFQPSDLAKYVCIIYLAKELASQREQSYIYKDAFLRMLLVILIIFGLIAPANLSTALLLLTTCLLLMYISGVRTKYLITFLTVGTIGVFLLINTVPRAETWKNRIKDYYARYTDVNYKPPYQVIQAHVAIVNGGFLGKGVGKSTQKIYLPHPYSDFIYAIIIEEYGIFMGIVILFLYLIFFIHVVVRLQKHVETNPFGSLLGIGLALLITLQALINMGVTTGLFPVTGLPLPFISLGGTSILFTGVSLGTIQNILEQVR